MSTGEIIHQVEKIDNLEDSKKQIEDFCLWGIKKCKEGLGEGVSHNLKIT